MQNRHVQGDLLLKNKYDKLFEELSQVDHLDATMQLVEFMKTLIFEDEQAQHLTKTRFLMFYLQYKYHHQMLEKEEKKHKSLLKRIYNLFFA